jgi:hypothetical protein
MNQQLVTNSVADLTPLPKSQSLVAKQPTLPPRKPHPCTTRRQGANMVVATRSSTTSSNATNVATVGISPGKLLTLWRESWLAPALAALLDHGMSFSDLCAHHWGPTCFSNFESLPHPASSFLASLHSRGAPAVQHTKLWSLERWDQVAARGPHQSTHKHIDFTHQEFSEMIKAGQWLVLPYSVVCNLPNLHLSPTGIVPQLDRCTRTQTSMPAPNLLPQTPSRSELPSTVSCNIWNAPIPAVAPSSYPKRMSPMPSCEFGLP